MVLRLSTPHPEQRGNRVRVCSVELVEVPTGAGRVDHSTFVGASAVPPTAGEPIRAYDGQPVELRPGDHLAYRVGHLEPRKADRSAPPAWFVVPADALTVPGARQTVHAETLPRRRFDTGEALLAGLEAARGRPERR